MTSVPSAADYLAAGLKLVAIPRGSKAPKDDGWQLEQNAIRNVEQANLLAGCNIGVAHLWSGTAAVDVDDYLAAVPWLAKRGIALDGYLAADDAVQISSGRPNHCKLWYRLPDGVIWLPTLNLRGSYGVGLELRCAAKDGSATVVDVIPPSLHPTGRPYEWKGDWRNPPELPEELLALWRRLAKNGTKPSAGRSKDGPIPEGGRNNFLASLAGSMRYRGMSESGIYAALIAENEERCVPPLPDADVAQIAKSVSRYAPGAPREEPPIGEAEARASTGGNSETSDGGAAEGGDEYTGVPATRDSEAGIAQAFTRKHGDDWRYVAAWGKWLTWSGQQWIAEPTLRVLDLIRSICLETAASIGTPSIKTRLSSVRTVSGADHLARMHRKHASTPGQWDADLWEANTMGGVVALTTGHRRPPCREDYMTKMMTATPRGDCPRWKAFLVEICGGDMELVAYLQRALGYSLTGATTEHMLIFLWGTGANGKSVFMTVIVAILGDYAVTAPLDTFMETRTHKHPTDVAGFRGARLVACTETEQGRRWAESKIKTLTGGDKVSARFMRQDFFTYTPQFKLWIAGNHKPYIRNVDEAMKRRVHLVPFTVTIPYERRDKRLTAKLLEERDGILAWMVEGCLEWQRIGLAPPKAVLDATEEYFQEEDAVGQFLQEECAPRKGAKTPVAEVFDRWRKRAEARGEHAATSRWLVRQLAARGFWATKGAKGAQVLEGLVLLVDSSAYNDAERFWVDEGG